MAWQVSKRVWKHAKDIKLNHKVMLLALADKADENGICWPKYDTSYETLASMVGSIERRSAIRLVNSLIETGHVIKFETVGRGHSNIFIVTSGLPDSEIERLKASIGDSPVTNNPINSDSPVTNPPNENGKKVTTPASIGDSPVTNNPINSDSPVTQSNMSPSIPSLAPNQLMFSALVNLCQYDLEIISEVDRGKLNQAEKKMRDKGYTPDDLNAFGRWWYANDWRGKRGQPPTLNQVRDTWGQYKKQCNGGHSRASPGRISAPIDQEKLKRLQTGLE